ncbi:MAG: permease-like cell division protein FtsX [Gemmatimonadaceae bacterium]
MRLALREVWRAVGRAPLLAVLGVITIAFSLYAFGLFGLVALNIREALGRVEERVEIRAFVADGTPVEAVAAAMGDIAAFPEVRHVEYVDEDQALVRARRELGEFRDVFETGVLPGSIEIRLTSGGRDPVTVKHVAARIANSYPFIDDVRYGQEWVEKLHRVRTVATVVGLVLGGAFAVVAMIIIVATIRMAVLIRSREIAIMRLVGATDGFVRLPFLIDGFAKGVAGGLLALALTWISRALIDRYLIETTFFDLRIALLGVLFGAIIGVVGSAASVGRHLRRV